MNPTQSNTCALVVTYQPDDDCFGRLDRLLAQFPLVIVVDNASTNNFKNLIDSLNGRSKVLLVRNDCNFGMGKALNLGLAYAKNRGFHYCATFDQDTAVFPELLKILLAVYQRQGQELALVGANYWNAHKGRNFLECADAGLDASVERKTLITSGTLMPLAMIDKIGGFREDYFIDSVDHEFCLRARSYGYLLFMTCRPLMSQNIGSEKIGSSLFSHLMSFDHSPARKYYIARNVVVTMKTYCLGEPLWVLRQAMRLCQDFLSILLFEKRKISKIVAFGKGIWHGIAGRLGPIEKTK